MGCKDRTPVTGGKGKACAMEVKSDATVMRSRDSGHNEVRLWLL